MSESRETDLGPLDEPKRRVPGFREGEHIRLFDGQSWTLRAPRVVTVAGVGGLGPTLIPVWTFGDAFGSHGPTIDATFGRQLLAVSGSAGIPDSQFYTDLVVPLAELMLLANYDLDAGECKALLVPSADHDPEDAATVVTAVTTAAVSRPLAAIGRAWAKLPYQDAEQYRNLNPTSN